MNAATSQEVFAGPYLDDPVERERFSRAFMDMTAGFLAFPLCLPGTAVWRGKRGRLYILGVLAKAAARSKAAMQVGLYCGRSPISWTGHACVLRLHIGKSGLITCLGNVHVSTSCRHLWPA